MIERMLTSSLKVGSVKDWDGGCGAEYRTQTAFFNGAYSGVVDNSWTVIGEDADQDGWSLVSDNPNYIDPDDSDPRVLACTEFSEEDTAIEDTALPAEDTGLGDTGLEGPKESVALCAVAPVDLGAMSLMLGVSALIRRRRMPVE